MSKQTLECPVDFVTVNENKVRLNALWVLVLGAAFLVINHWSIPALLMIDFYLRGFHEGKFSLLNKLSSWVEQALNVSFKPIDRAPKRFAAQVGFIVTDLILICSFIGLHDEAFYLDILLVTFALLESAFNICAGCYMYTLLKKVGMIGESSTVGNN